MQIREGEVYRYNKCYYAPQTLNVECDCLKVFFNVYIDFKLVTISVCKDYYDLLFINRLNKSDSRCFIDGIKRAIDSRAIQVDIINDIVIDMFGGYFPHYPSVHLHSTPGGFFDTSPQLQYTNVPIIARPHYSIRINSFSLFKIIGEAKNNGEYIQGMLREAAIGLAHQSYDFIKSYKKYKYQALEFEKKMFGGNSRRWCDPTFNIDSALILFEVLTYNKNKQDVTSKQ